MKACREHSPTPVGKRRHGRFVYTLGGSKRVKWLFDRGHGANEPKAWCVTEIWWSRCARWWITISPSRSDVFETEKPYNEACEDDYQQDKEEKWNAVRIEFVVESELFAYL